MPRLKIHPRSDWSLDEALELIRAIQPECHELSYHVALGGGVLNRGYSAKDLDLYFLPFSDTANPSPDALRAYLRVTIGDENTLGGPYVWAADVDVAYPPQTATFPGGRFTYWGNGKRIDVFIA
jgi:hypothetical protein